MEQVAQFSLAEVAQFWLALKRKICSAKKQHVTT
jgi:hypothetical protein